MKTQELKMNAVLETLRTKPNKSLRVGAVALSLFYLFSSQLYAKDVNVPLTDAKINKVLKDAYNKFKDDNGGKNADYIKELAIVDSKIFGISIVTADGKVYEAGDTTAVVSIQSISKVFTAAKVMQEKGDKFVQEKIGVNATGMAFNSVIAIELHGRTASNPFVNAGAIQSTSWVEAKDSKERPKTLKSVGQRSKRTWTTMPDVNCLLTRRSMS